MTLLDGFDRVCIFKIILLCWRVSDHKFAVSKRERKTCRVLPKTGRPRGDEGRGALALSLRDAVDRRSRRPEGGIMQAEGGIMGPKGGIISIWPEGCGVINTLSHKKADNP